MKRKKQGARILARKKGSRRLGPGKREKVSCPKRGSAPAYGSKLLFLTWNKNQERDPRTAAIFDENQKIARLEKLRNEKICRKLFRRASACAQMFLAVIACAAVLGQIPLRRFFCARSNSFLFARNAQQTKTPARFQRARLSALCQILSCWRTVLLMYWFLIWLSNDAHVIQKTFQRAFVYAWSNSFVLALSSSGTNSYLNWAITHMPFQKLEAHTSKSWFN